MRHSDLAGHALTIIVGRMAEEERQERIAARQIVVDFTHVLEVFYLVFVLAVKFAHDCRDLILSQLRPKEN
jgi:hypothetical protein